MNQLIIHLSVFRLSIQQTIGTLLSLIDGKVFSGGNDLKLLFWIFELDFFFKDFHDNLLWMLQIFNYLRTFKIYIIEILIKQPPTNVVSQIFPCDDQLLNRFGRPLYLQRSIQKNNISNCLYLSKQKLRLTKETKIYNGSFC